MFYQGLHIAYAVLLCAALWLNRACWRGLTLSATVGAIVIFLEIPWVWPTHFWYLEWFIVEMLLIAFALYLKAPSSHSVAIFSALLGLGHLMGAYFGPSDGVGPYRLIQPMLETCQLLMLVALSHSARDLLETQILRTKNLRGRHV